jgi:hypothetical protein
MGAFQPPGKSALASLSETEGAMITSSPGRQFTGVATLAGSVPRRAAGRRSRSATRPEALEPSPAAWINNFTSDYLKWALRSMTLLIQKDPFLSAITWFRALRFELPKFRKRKNC